MAAHTARVTETCSDHSDDLPSSYARRNTIKHLAELNKRPSHLIMDQTEKALMNLKDPKLVALQFNEYINNQDIQGLTSLMTEDHTFIDRNDEIHRRKETMTTGWIDFFQAFPDYRNTFTRVESQHALVILIGYATWSKGSQPDYAIWTARIEHDLVAEWRIYPDTEQNRRKLKIV